jgi:hypothetical protein
VFGALQFAEYGSVVGAILAGLFFGLVLGLFLGAFMALWMGRSWPGAKALNSADRVAVVRASRRGEEIGDARLAPAVIDYCSVLRKTQERDRRFQWALWLPAGLSLIIALGETFTGSARGAFVWWFLVAFWLVFLTWLPRKRARVLSNVQQAEALARRALG